VADEILDRTDVMGQFLGERQRFSDQTRDALSQRVIEALDIIGFPGMLRDGFVSLRRNDTAIGVVLICMECGLLTVHRRDLGPQLFGTVTTAIPDVKRNDLTRLGVHGDPDPLLIGLLLYKAPQLIGFGFQLPKHHISWTGWLLDVSHSTQFSGNALSPS
jgi:hypothetical protein